MYTSASSESSSVSTLSAAVFSGLSSLASSGDRILNSAIVVLRLMVKGVGVVLVTLMSIFLLEAVEMELATTRGSPLQWLVAGFMTPVVSTFDGVSVEPVIVCVVSGGIVSGFLICTLYNFLLRVYSSVSIEYVRWGKCNRPWLTSRIALLFLRNVRPSIGPVRRLATIKVSLKFQSPISNWRMIVLVGVSMSPFAT